MASTQTATEKMQILIFVHQKIAGTPTSVTSPEKAYAEKREGTEFLITD